MAVDEFTKSLNASDESIMGAMWDTADAAEKFGMLQQKIKLLIEPLGSAVFDNVAKLMPTIIRLFELLAPVVEELVEILVPLVDTVFVALADIIEVLSPLLMALAKVIGSMMTAAIRTVMPVFNNLMEILKNIIDFVVNVFSLQWGEAWHNLVNIVKNVFKGLFNTILAPFKFVFEYFNSLGSKISGNGQKALANAPLPAYASGGFTDGISIAGEAGTEAVISFDPAYRAKNIDIWQKAGQLLGIGSSSGGSYNLGGFTFSPKLYISESMSADDVINKLKSAEGEFCDMIDEWLARKTAGSYSGTSMAY